MAAEEKLNKHATHRIVLTQCGHRFFTSGRPFHDRCFDQSDTSCSEERGKGIHISRFNREEGCRERERFSEKKQGEKTERFSFSSFLHNFPLP
jgi:hypothetical protein